MPNNSTPMQLPKRKPWQVWTRRAVAVLAAIIVVTLLEFGVDELFYALGVLPRGPHGIFHLHLLEISYRILFAVFGGYLAAWLAPDFRFRHAIAYGTVSLALSTLGAITTWNMNLAPAWFTLTLVVIALPAAWLGGKLKR